VCIIIFLYRLFILIDISNSPKLEKNQKLGQLSSIGKEQAGLAVGGASFLICYMRHSIALVALAVG